MLCYTAYSVRTDCCRWTGTSALIPSCCFVSRWNVCRWNGTSALIPSCCFVSRWNVCRWNGTSALIPLCCFVSRWNVCRWNGTSALIPLCCFVSRWNVCRWNGTSAFSLWTMLFCFWVKWLQVKWYICFQSLNYAVLFLGEMIAGEMVHLLSVSELCCFVFGWNDCRWNGTSAFSHSMLFRADSGCR